MKKIIMSIAICLFTTQAYSINLSGILRGVVKNADNVGSAVTKTADNIANDIATPVTVITPRTTARVLSKYQLAYNLCKTDGFEEFNFYHKHKHVVIETANDSLTLAEGDPKLVDRGWDTAIIVLRFWYPGYKITLNKFTGTIKYYEQVGSNKYEFVSEGKCKHKLKARS